MAVSPIPSTHNTVSPYLVLDDVAGEIDFMKAAFGAEELERITLPNGKIMHAEMRIGDSVVMLGGAQEGFSARPGMMHVYCEEVDAVYAKALAAGATTIMEPQDQFYGNREGGVADPQGNQWWIGSRIEELTNEQLHERAASARGM